MEADHEVAQMADHAVGLLAGLLEALRVDVAPFLPAAVVASFLQAAAAASFLRAAVAASKARQAVAACQEDR